METALREGCFKDNIILERKNDYLSQFKSEDKG